MACLDPIFDLSFLTPRPRTPAVGLWIQFDGGAIANYGGDIEFNAGVLFEENSADSSGDGGIGGGIYHTRGGVVT